MISKILSNYINYLPQITTISRVANPFISIKLNEFINNKQHNFYKYEFINKTPCMELITCNKPNHLTLDAIKILTEQVNKSIYDTHFETNHNSIHTEVCNSIQTDVYYNLNRHFHFLKRYIMLKRSWYMISKQNSLCIKSIVVYDIYDKLEDVNIDWYKFNSPNYNINLSHFQKNSNIDISNTISYKLPINGC